MVIQDVLLLSEEKLRQLTDINDNLDSKLITSAIVVAQDIEIQRIIGTKLYERIQELVKTNLINDPTNEKYKYILDAYIEPTLLWATYYDVLENIYIRPRNNGLLRPTGGENSQTVDADLYDRKRQSAKNRKEWYAEMLVRYMIEKQSNYPELGSIQWLYQLFPDFANQLRSPIVFRNNGRAWHADAVAELGLQMSDSRWPQFPWGANINWK